MEWMEPQKSNGNVVDGATGRKGNIGWMATQGRNRNGEEHGLS